jgi:hypothetical protein
MGRWFAPAVGGALLVACLVVSWQNRQALEEVRSLIGAERPRLDALAAAQQRQLGATAALEQVVLRLGDRSSARAGEPPPGPGRLRATPPSPGDTAAASEPAGAAPTAEAEGQAATAEAQAATAAAHQLVNVAISRGRWTQQDHIELLQRKALMSPAAYQDEMQRLVLAINAGKISLDDPRAF